MKTAIEFFKSRFSVFLNFNHPGLLLAGRLSGQFK